MKGTTMRRYILTVLAIVLPLLAVAMCTPVRAAGWSGMNKQIDQTNFVVNSGCSGTLIDLAGRYVLTANHCVEDQYETVEREKISDDGVVTRERIRKLKPGTVKQIYFNGASEIRETTYRTKLVAVDRNKDLALLQVVAPLPNAEASKLACVDPKRGDSVFVVGNPMGVLYSSVVPGMVSSIQREYGTLGVGAEDTEPLLQVSGGIVGGNSGGAVYDTSGSLVGVPVLSHRVNEVLGFAVPLGAIKDFLKTNKLESLYAHCTADK